MLWGDKQRFSIHSSIVYTPKGLIIMGTAVITGGGTGLGKELAKQLSDKGYDILLVGRREQPLKETVQSILASGGHATYDIMDVRSRTEIEQTLSTWGSRDIELLVHNAGVGYFGPLESSTDEEMVATFETNVFGPIRLTKAMIEAVPHRAFTVINVISTAGLRGKKNETLYAASKFALRGFGESLQKEYEGSQIRIVNAFMGGMNTPFWDESDHVEDPSRFRSPAEVAKMIVSQYAETEAIIIESKK
ncbi:SDR family NAD(P)-dependent oxidoreductase [Rossellomorea sp. FS2]|uniref:SDR family NAD(P)-dependent oxidoreductase n=1 Tax=Rossellomorea sp. FS2 TaxID=3391447 RepID=UPI003A4DF99F